MTGPRDIKDLKKYEGYLKAVGSLSGLFSDSPRPLINYRTAEKLFNLHSGAKDVGRLDNSFDSMIQASLRVKIGVGVKTFTANSPEDSSTEKIAEFSNPAFVSSLSKVTGKKLAITLSEFRNKRVSSDALQLGLQLDQSYYHCVVRLPGSVVIHEEPYELIDFRNLHPTDARGEKVQLWSSSFDGHLYFSDELNLYTFHRGKNVLQKRFNLARGYTSAPVPVGILSNAFERIFASFGGGAVVDLSSELGFISNSRPIQLDPDQVVLPLYSPGKMVVQARSGINNWNAAGRKRKFGEAYIPVPSIVHKLKPGFFPPRDEPFTVALPTGEKISAKLCQEGSKALMSDPNTAIFTWLYELIDGSLETANNRLPINNAYTYQDLLKIGKDSVCLSKSSTLGVDYDLELVSIGSFETFLETASKNDS
jgi:hypothetical protein